MTRSGAWATFALPLTPGPGGSAMKCPRCQQENRLGATETYTPKHLAERIINSKAAVEGERKQVTVLFADLKGSMELLADRDTSKSAPRHWAWAALMRRAF